MAMVEKSAGAVLSWVKSNLRVTRIRQRTDAQLLELIVGRWDAIESGVHRVRDVTFGEDACQVARPKAARGRTKAPSLPSWQHSMTASAALKRVTG